jgi:hypothetical protein
MSKTDIQESAQALFCALANKHGATNIDKTFNKTIHKTYADFKIMWNKEYAPDTIETAFKNHVDTGSTKLSQIENLLAGVGEKTKSKQNEWYYSSLSIAKQLIKEIQKISSKFSYVRTGDWSNIFWRRGDKEVMENIAILYKKANDHQKKLYEKNPKISRPFDNINKWSTADIYFASEKTKDEIKKLAQEKKVDYMQLNSFISKKIAEGGLLPLSLKKQPDKVQIKKVNFSRPEEQKKIDLLSYAGTAGAVSDDEDSIISGGRTQWKIWDGKSDISKYAKTLMIYMSEDKKMLMQIRHDISTTAYKGIIFIPGSGGFEGSLTLKPLIYAMKSVDSKNSGIPDTILKTYDEQNIKYKKQKENLENLYKNKDNKQYDIKRKEQSALLITNVINPLLIKWLDEDETRANLFIRAVYTYATARSKNSSKYVLAK